VARQPGPGLVHHSDRGVQYASQDYTEMLKQHKATILCSGFDDGRAIEGVEGVAENVIAAAVSVMAQNPADRRAEKALASFHVKQRLVFSYCEACESRL
jgi:putative transposase